MTLDLDEIYSIINSDGGMELGDLVGETLAELLEEYEKEGKSSEKVQKAFKIVEEVLDYFMKKKNADL